MAGERKHTQGRLCVDYDHTNGKPPYTLAVGDCETGDGWEWIGSIRQRDDAEFICLAWNSHYELLEALEAAQKALAMMIAPEAIKQTTTMNAFAAATEAEAKARAAINSARATGGEG